MILLPLLILVTAHDAPADAPTAPDVTVMGERLRKLRLSVDADAQGKIVRCVATVSSGDAALDAQACTATSACADQGIRGGEAMADCVDRNLVAFVKAENARNRAGNGNDADN